MKVLLINPKFNSWTLNVYVPLGLCYIAAVLEEQGREVQILDLNARDYEKSEIEKAISSADIIGLTGMITEYDKVCGLADEIRRRQKPLIIGGPMASSMPRKILADTGAQAIVINEGEITIAELTQAIEHGGDLSSVAGIIYIGRHDEEKLNNVREYIQDIDAIPFPARHLLDMDRYAHDYLGYVGLKVKGFGKLRGTNMQSSRGCPFACKFCARVPWGRRWRPRSAQSLKDEMMHLLGRYGINEFLYCDDNFVLNRNRVMRFCELLQKEKMPVVWSCNARVDEVDKEMLAAMYAVGCRNIGYGVESGNQAVLESMGKDIKLASVRRAVELTRAAGINATGYFIIGYKGETRQTINDTLDFARGLRLDFYGFSFASPLPGSELYEELGLGDNLLGYKEYSTYSNFNMTQDCSDSELAECGGRVFREFTLKHRFGRLFYLSPYFYITGAQMLINLLRRGQAKQWVKKLLAVFASKT